MKEIGRLLRRRSKRHGEAITTEDDRRLNGGSNGTALSDNVCSLAQIYL